MNDYHNRDGKKADPSVPKEDARIRRHFYALLTRWEKTDDDVGKSYFSCSDMSSL